MKIVVIGHPNAVLGFTLVGVNGIVATSAAEINLALDNAILAKDIGIVLVTEDAAALIEARMDDLKAHSTEPLVVEIPAPNGTQEGRRSLSEIVFRAIGVKI